MSDNFGYFAVGRVADAWKDRSVAKFEAEKAKALSGEDDAR